MAKQQVTRRRFIQIFAAASMMPMSAFSAENKSMIHWDGVSLGADSSIKLFHPDKQKAKRLLRLCLTEISRLEKIFSIYRTDSTIVELNKNGFVNRPPQEFTELLQIAKFYGDITSGEFDITVQPLWDSQGRASDLLQLIDYKKINISEDQIKFEKAGMQITLNGIAQGYITDRITAMLKDSGIENALVELGEKYAIGKHPLGRKWNVGIADKDMVVGIENQAIATSSNSEMTHLYDPRTGKIKQGSVTIIADNATKADALSTGLCGLGVLRSKEVLGNIEGAEVVRA